MTFDHFASDSDRDDAQLLLLWRLATCTSPSTRQFPNRLRLLQTLEQHVLHLSGENPEMLSIWKGLKNLIILLPIFAHR